MDWTTLRSVLTGYPELSLTGRYRSREDSGTPEPAGDTVIWREGRRLRVEFDGEPEFISDGVTAWSFRDTDRLAALQGTPLTGPVDSVRYYGPAQGFTTPRSARDWSNGDFSGPEGPVTSEQFQGRDCWTVALNASCHKIGPLRMWVDRESGHLLGMANEHPDAAGSAEWISTPVIGVPLSESLFSWGGPTVEQDDVDAASEAELLEPPGSQRAWFRDNVTGERLTVPATVSAVPDQLHHDRDGGSVTVDNSALVVRIDPDRKVTVNFRSPAVVRDDQLETELRRRFGVGDTQ